MNNLMVEFEELKTKHQTDIEILKDKMQDGYLPDMLKLRKAYSKYISELNNIFDKYDYIVPYELYKFFYQLSAKRYNLLFGCSERIKSGNLAGAFLKEAIGDLERGSISTLLLIEQTSNYADYNNNN